MSRGRRAVGVVGVALAAVLLSLGAAPAQSANGDTVYRCGNTYAHVPCADARVIDAADPVTAERTADAARTAARERRLAEQMASDRRADEAAIHPARAGSLGPARVAQAASAPTTSKKKTKKRTGTTADGDFIARVPKTKVAKN